MKDALRLLLASLLFAGVSVPAHAQHGDRFFLTQVRHGGIWDPYPEVHHDILAFLTRVTSVVASPGREVLRIEDPKLFSSPLLLLTGRGVPPAMGAGELEALRDYLTSGGVLWIEDATGSASSSFDRWVRRMLKEALPDADLRPLPPEHVLFKTFFLLRKIGGRVEVAASVEGLDWGGKTVVLYSRNDLLGAWARDPLGKYLHPCMPGGEPQRMEARKLTLNILLYALTGTYKADAVHQPYILRKMRSGVP